jgi:hypothetical protein
MYPPTQHYKKKEKYFDNGKGSSNNIQFTLSFILSCLIFVANETILKGILVLTTSQGTEQLPLWTALT